QQHSMKRAVHLLPRLHPPLLLLLPPLLLHLPLQQMRNEHKRVRIGEEYTKIVSIDKWIKMSLPTNDKSN
ncbi:MAG: hypothetical protein EZS28_016797, partial [Streblomastix strix]